MGLKATFAKGVEALFKAAGDVVKEGTYVLVADDGWDDAKETEYSPLRVITDKFTQKDVEASSFSELIQHTDTKGLVPAVDFTYNDIIPKSGNVFKVNDVTFTIVAFEIDPADVLYTLLLRNTV